MVVAYILMSIFCHHSQSYINKIPVSHAYFLTHFYRKFIFFKYPCMFIETAAYHTLKHDYF